jgi:hypothetical protein
MQKLIRFVLFPPVYLSLATLLVFIALVIGLGFP